MAMDFMAHRALSASSSLCLLLILPACRQYQQPLNYCNEAEHAIQLQNGVAWQYGQVFSGRLYRLAGNGKDTLYCMDYRDGKADGRHIRWYEGGQVKMIRYYRKGRKEGMLTSFWPGGQKRTSCHFREDCYEGAQYEWFANGQPASVRHFRAGHEAGLQQVFTQDGKLFSNYEAKNGRNYGNIGTKHCTPVDAAPML
jgi:antitoxin component YwqK of YwqJK toxin-antitoxin module